MSKMRRYINLVFLILIFSLFSCEKFLEPNPDGSLSDEEITSSPGFAEGLLLTAYYNLPVDYDFATDIASDDAVTNEKGSPYRQMATGNWKSSNDPISKWANSYEQIYYINKFLEIYQDVIWANDKQLSKEINDIKNALHMKRLKGEAYGLRGYYKWQLLQYHAGKAVDGRFLGFPIVDEVIQSSDDYKLARNTFAECVASIFTDLDTAIANLPAVWKDGSDANVNITSGARFENRINGNTARAIKSRVALLAASPAFADANAVTWEEAATIAGDLLSDLGPLYNKGVTFYNDIRSKEIIWNRSKVQARNWEENNFPPSLFGYGRTNPSQELIDAFPMANGYPIDDTLGGYNPDNPYANRDPRFYNYIIYNDAVFKQVTVSTFVGAAQDGVGSLETSTRTGYYLKKLMSDKAVLTPGSPVDAVHNFTYVRMTEVLLNYAEAANEAWGPDGDPNGYGFTAMSKIQELRSRAGLTPDEYMETINDQASLRELIRNERRIELCFEGFRFWDIRRWNDQAILTAPVRGVYITMNQDSTFTYNYSDIEERIYTPDMIYGPIPYEETLKYNIEQNIGW
jgi:hypothetical protein